MYNEIEDCLEKLDVVSYKLGLTLGEKLWENLTLNPPTNLWDFMSRVKMFNWLEDDVRQAERATRSSSQGDGSFKKQRESLEDYESCMRQGIYVIFKEPIYKFLARIRDKLYFKKLEPLGGEPKRCNQRWKCLYHEEKGHKIKNLWALKSFLD